MAAFTIRKASNDGIGYSVVDLNDVRHVFATAVPRGGNTLSQQAADALGTIEAVAREEGSRGAIVHQTVFLAHDEHTDECRQIIREFYGKDLPATSYVPQPPCEGKLLSIECLGVGQERGRVEIERVSEQLVVARHNGIAWAHCAQAVPPPHITGVHNGLLDSFEQVDSLLNRVNMRFGQVIRTWFYCGAIGQQDGVLPRYQELNQARSKFFENIRFLEGCLPQGRCGSIYPSSTGIGAEGRGVMLSAVALATERKDIIAVPLENPRQKSAYDYSRDCSPISPKFSRAMALSCGDYATIFVSGTASIVGEQTQHLGDAVAQTHETLDNIAALISAENLARHGLPGLDISLESLAMVRVYLKRSEDFAAVRAVCQSRLGELPTVYVTADVCRPELLVEIEGIAVARRCK